jgi:hypothetical protein
MFPKIPGEEDLFKTLDDLDHDPSRGKSYQIQVMETVRVLATFNEVGHNLRKFVAKQRGQFTFGTFKLRSGDIFYGTFRIKLIHTRHSFLGYTTHIPPISCGHPFGCPQHHILSSFLCQLNKLNIVFYEKRSCIS